jgi:NADH-quinone oxidoreductase subunit G
MRVWFLKQTNSIDTESSAGANTVVWSREGVIYRITPRRNDAVNDTWMADSGRELYKQVRANDRLTAVKVNGTEGTLEAALKAAGELFRANAGGITVVGSGRSSVEEQYLTRRLAHALQASAQLVSRTAQGDGLLVSADRNPNVRGALVTGLIKELPTAKLTDLAAGIDSGRIRAVVAINEDLTAAGITAAQLAKVAVVYVGTQANATSAAARVVLPTLTVFEKAGSFINQQFRLQKFLKCVPGVAGAHEDLAVLAGLATAGGATSVPADANSVWTALAAEVPALAGRSLNTLPEDGVALDAAPFAHLAFIEGPGLHFQPAVPAKA